MIDMFVLKNELYVKFWFKDCIENQIIGIFRT